MIVKAPPITIPLGGGLRTDIDPKLLPLGNVLELENARQVRTGEIVNRFGGNALSNAVNSAVLTSLTQPAWQLANYKADLIRLQRVGPQPISRWSPTMGKWTYVDWSDYSNAQPPIQSALRGPFSYTTAAVGNFGTEGTSLPDVASAVGYLFTAFLLNNSIVVVIATDQSSGEVVWKYTVTGTTNTRPRLATVGNFVVLAWVNKSSATIDAMSIDATTIRNAAPTIIFTASVGTLTHATPLFDVIADGANVAMAWRTSTNKLFGAEYTASTGAHVNYEIKTSAAASINPEDTLGFIQNPVGYANLGIATTSHTAVGVMANAGFRGTGASAQTHVLDGVLSANSITGSFTTASPTAEVNVIYTVQGADKPYDYLKFAEFTGGSIFASIFVRSVFLQSKMFRYNGDNYVIAEYFGGTVLGLAATGTYFLMRIPIDALSAAPPSGSSGGPLGKILVGNASGNDANMTSVVSVPSPTGAMFSAAIGRFNRLDLEPTTGGERYNGIVNLSLGIDQVLGSAVQAADSLYVPGAQLTVFDGQVFADDGFPVTPEPVTLASNPGGAMTPGGLYGYVSVFSETDANGRKNSSAPSIPTLVTIAGGQGSAMVTIKNLSLTQRTLAYTGKVNLETYRTDNINAGAAANVYQLLRVDVNDPTADSTTFVDGAASIAVGTPLYTDGGILKNDTTPGFSSLAVFQGRIWGVDMEFPDTLWYSDEIADGLTSPHWSIDRNLLIQDEHGGITAIKALDDKLVVFKKDAVYVVTGQGPDATGANDAYRSDLVAIGIGTTNPQSACVIGLGIPGVVFQSTSQRAGFYVLDRGVSLQYIGAQVQQYMEAASAAILVTGQSQVRFYTASGRTLVYDLVSQIWSTFTGQPAIHAACWADVVAAYSRVATADVVVEDPTGATWTEAGVAYGIHLATPWLQINQLNGYERFFRIQGVGMTVGAHTLRVRLYKDFDDTALLTDQTVTPGPLWDWETRYSSKLVALKAVLDVAGSTEAAKMTALALIVGVKQGLKKLPSANRTT